MKSVDLAIGRLALHYVEENLDEVVAALCGPARPSSTSLATRPTGVVSSCASDSIVGAIPPARRSQIRNSEN
jgi:hypothetical protein